MPTRIDELTDEQKARMPEWRDKWISIGLKTGEADWEEFEKQVKVAYEKANLPVPKTIVHVQSPIVGGFAAPLADAVIAKLKKRGAVHGAVDDAVRGAVDGAVDDAVRGAVDDAVDDAVRGAVRDAVGGAVGDAVNGAVGGAVRDAVGGAVDDAVRGAVGNLQWYNYLGGQFWVGGWYWGSPSYVSFFTEVCDLELSQDISERANCYQQIAKSVCWWWPYRDFVMVCNRPSEIHRDEQGRLHSEVGNAIEWPDGWGFHVLKGERFDKPEEVELWEKIVSKTITAEEVMQIQDVDKRTIAISMLSPEELIKQLNATLVDAGSEGTKLYRCDNFMGTRKTEYCMVMKDWSTPRMFVEFVPPEIGKLGSAVHAQASAFGIPDEDYLLITERG